MCELDDLNMRIARIKGFHFYEVDGNGAIVPCDCTRQHKHDAVLRPRPGAVFWGNGIEMPCLDWSRKIEAAWDLWNELPTDKRIEQNNRFVTVLVGGSYGADTDINADFEATAITAPEAISRAWLAWKGATK